MFAVTGVGFIRGTIVEWHSTIASIPSGWAFCNGENGTPDLRDKVPAGAKQDDAGVAKTNISGSLLQSGGNLSHTHTVDYTSNTMENATDEDANMVLGTSSTEVHLPPFRAAVFMMKL